MVVLDTSQQQFNAKIIYYGPGLSGKTTCIQYIGKVFSKSAQSSLVSFANISGRTLYFDFLSLDAGYIKGYPIRFLIYSVPGQVFYEATRKLIISKVDGAVFVADSQKDRLEANLLAMQSLKHNLLIQKLEVTNIPFAIQYNKSDLPFLSDMNEMEDMINPMKSPSFLSCALTGQGVLEALKVVCIGILDRMNTYL